MSPEQQSEAKASAELVKQLREEIISDAFENRQIVSSKLAERLIRERSDAAATIDSLQAEVERLKRKKSEIAREALAADGQAREHLEARTAAEARLSLLSKGGTRPAPQWVTTVEGGEWQAFGTSPTVHAIEFADGSIFDAINGWREKSATPDSGREG